jgi:hypothetical protein
MAVVITLAPETTSTATASSSPQPTPAALIVVVAPTPTPTPPPDTAPSAPMTIVLTPTPEGAVRQFGASEVNALPMEWIISTYLVVQAGVIALGLFALLRRR